MNDTWNVQIISELSMIVVHYVSTKVSLIYSASSQFLMSKNRNVKSEADLTLATSSSSF